MKKFLVVVLLIGLISSCDKEEEAILFDLTLTAQEGGTVTSVSGTYEEGETISIQAIPNDGFLFSSWSGGISSTENPYPLVMDKAYSINAVFERKTYDLTVAINGEGQVNEEVISASRSVNSGSTVRLTAIPDEGWEFVSWTGDLGSSEPVVEININEAKTITANFTQILQSVQIEVTGNGSYESSFEDITMVPWGTELTLTAVEEGSYFRGWSGFTDSEDKQITITVTEDLNLSMDFFNTVIQIDDNQVFNQEVFVQDFMDLHNTFPREKKMVPIYDRGELIEVREVWFIHGEAFKSYNVYQFIKDDNNVITSLREGIGFGGQADFNRTFTGKENYSFEYNQTGHIAKENYDYIDTISDYLYSDNLTYNLESRLESIITTNSAGWTSQEKELRYDENGYLSYRGVAAGDGMYLEYNEKGHATDYKYYQDGALRTHYRLSYDNEDRISRREDPTRDDGFRYNDYSYIGEDKYELTALFVDENPNQSSQYQKIQGKIYQVGSSRFYYGAYPTLDYRIDQSYAVSNELRRLISSEVFVANSNGTLDLVSYATDYKYGYVKNSKEIVTEVVLRKETDPNYYVKMTRSYPDNNVGNTPVIEFFDRDGNIYDTSGESNFFTDFIKRLN